MKGKLGMGESKKFIIEVFRKHGPMTSGELHLILVETYKMSFMRSNMNGIINDLETRGFINMIGMKRNKKGRHANIYAAKSIQGVMPV